MASPVPHMKTFFKTDIEPRAVTKAKKRAADEAALQDTYAEVDARDGGICWVTGRYTVAGSPDRRNRRERHHLQGRNVAPERVTDPTNIITTCSEAHSLIEAGLIVVEGIDTRQPIRFHWRADVPAKSKIFQIRSRRWSQNDE